jgi:hypothetical protein
MFNSDFSRIALSAVGALFFSVTVVGAAVGPAHMVERAPLVYAMSAPQLAGAADA